MTLSPMPDEWKEGFWASTRRVLRCVGYACGAKIVAGAQVYCSGEPGDVWCSDCVPLNVDQVNKTRGPARKVVERLADGYGPNRAYVRMRLACGHIVVRGQFLKYAFCDHCRPAEAESV